MLMPKMAKARKTHVEYVMVTNCVIFSAFKHTDPLTVLGRPTLKDGKVNGVYSDTGSSANSKWQKDRMI